MLMGCSRRMSTFLRRTPPLRWTSHMAECLKIVDEQMEAPLDRILVYQVRLQRISDEAPCTLMITNSELSEQTRLLRSFQTRALLSRVEELRQTLPPDLPEDCKYNYLYRRWSCESTCESNTRNPDVSFLLASGHDMPSSLRRRRGRRQRRGSVFLRRRPR